MQTHPYVRAYLAGVFIPTFVLPVLLIAFLVVRMGMQVTVPLERGLVFPMAMVPLLWGLWNMLWLASHPWTRLPLGVHGAVLPFLLLPVGASLASCLGILALGPSGVTWFQSLYVPYVWIAPCFLAALAGYYLAWKYVVGFANRVLGIA